WETVDARFYEETARTFAARPEGDRKALARSYSDADQGLQLFNQGRYREAQALVAKALATHRTLLGEEHPDTALCYTNLAACLNAQGKHAEAAKGHRRALALRKKLLGEEHPHTATCYTNLALTLHEQGKHAEAEQVLRH